MTEYEVLLLLDPDVSDDRQNEIVTRIRETVEGSGGTWDRHDVWALAYVPGFHHGDNETYAVHKPSGRVVGGDCHLTRQECGESTEAWLSRLDA